VSTTHAPFLAFNPRSEEGGVFSSLEFNYGHPSQLLVTAEAAQAAEPASIVLTLSALFAAGTFGRRREARREPAGPRSSSR